MAAVVRIKRSRDEDPIESFILNCKKRKTDNNSIDKKEELATLLQFAGTVDKQDDIFKHLNKKPTKTELEEQFKKHITDISVKLRMQKEENTKNSRYKIINCFRSQNVLEKPEVTIYDIETENNEINVDKEDNKYVYDLYYTMSDDLGEACLEEYVSVYPCNGELMYGSARDNGLKDADSDGDSEDSNDENNWRNDYPDESDIESINENDMVQAMKTCGLSDLSSDDGEGGFIYSVDSEAAGFEEDIDDTDVQRYGERYARFKARHNTKMQNSTLEKDLYYGDIDEDEFYN